MSGPAERRAISSNALGAAVLAVALGLPSAAAQPPFVGSDRDQDAILESMQGGYPLEIRQVGTSSVTLRVDVPNARFAFKPRTDSHPRGYAAEIAAYRIARRLGMDNVPPVIGLRIPRRVLRDRFRGAHSTDDWGPIEEDIRWDAPGVVRGAAIHWIPRMRPTELSTEDGADAVTDWLRVDGPIPEGREGIARDLSTLFAFDYLIGNWDRLSGGNVSTTDAGDRLFVRDHNAAFDLRLTPARYARIRANLERVQRFSRGFVRTVMALDEDAVREALGEDPLAADQAILLPVQIEGLLARRRAFLSYVGALIAVHGAERVLRWD